MTNDQLTAELINEAIRFIKTMDVTAINQLHRLMEATKGTYHPPLFQLGSFTLASGQNSYWKVECDSLTNADWVALATLAAERLPRFGRVEGVPTGGFPFASALELYATHSLNDPVLIAEDVLTTGESMEQFRAGCNAIGVVAFARGPCPSWVTPIWSLSPSRKKG